MQTRVRTEWETSRDKENLVSGSVMNKMAGNTLDTVTRFPQSGRNDHFNRYSFRFIISHFFPVSVKTLLYSDLSLEHFFFQEKLWDFDSTRGTVKTILLDVTDRLACNYCHTWIMAVVREVLEKLVILRTSTLL